MPHKPQPVKVEELLILAENIPAGRLRALIDWILKGREESGHGEFKLQMKDGKIIRVYSTKAE